jgi:hypothetical protein
MGLILKALVTLYKMVYKSGRLHAPVRKYSMSKLVAYRFGLGHFGPRVFSRPVLSSRNGKIVEGGNVEGRIGNKPSKLTNNREILYFQTAVQAEPSDHNSSRLGQNS